MHFLGLRRTDLSHEADLWGSTDFGVITGRIPKPGCHDNSLSLNELRSTGRANGTGVTGGCSNLARANGRAAR